MRYMNFAVALRRYGTVKEIQERLGVKSRTQVFQYLAGKALPRTEKLLVHPDLLDAARSDLAEQTKVSA